jgi:hypothetical protein
MSNQINLNDMARILLAEEVIQLHKEADEFWDTLHWATKHKIMELLTLEDPRVYEVKRSDQ